MIETATAVVTLLADDPRNTGPDFGKASPFGLLIVVVLLIGTFALVWSMNRHLRKLPESFDREHPEPDQAADDGTVPDGTVPDGTVPDGTTAEGTAPNRDEPADGDRESQPRESGG